MKMIRSAALILAAAMTLMATACKKDGGVTVSGSDGSSSSTGSNSSETFLDKASKFLEADGRGYGKEHSAEIGEVLKNEFFSLKVTEAYRYSSMGDYLPDEGYDFVAVNITVGNIFDAFQVGNLHTSYDISFFPDDTNLSVGASKSGYVIFEAPSDSTELVLEYLEVYEDDFEGNTYHINLGNPEFAADDYKPPESKDIYANIGETISTSDFDMCVNSVNSADTLGGYTADDGYKLIAADVTLSGTTEEEEAVGASLFYIILTLMEDGEPVDYYVESIESTYLSGDAEFFPEAAALAKGDSITGVILFEVPADSTGLSFSTFDSSETEDIMYSIALGDIDSIAPFNVSV